MTEKEESNALNKELRTPSFSHTLNLTSLAHQGGVLDPLSITRLIQILDQAKTVLLLPTCNSNNRIISLKFRTKPRDKASLGIVATKRTTIITCQMHRTAKKAAWTIE